MYIELDCKNEKKIGESYDCSVISFGAKNNSIYLSKQAFYAFRKFDGVVVLFDEEKNTLALRPSSYKAPNACKMIPQGKRKVFGRFYCQAVIKRIKYDFTKGTVRDAVWNDELGLLEVSLVAKF